MALVKRSIPYRRRGKSAISCTNSLNSGEQARVRATIAVRTSPSFD